MAEKISRREFLKFGSTAFAASLWKPVSLAPTGDDPFPMRFPSYQLGRAALSGFYYKDADFNSQKMKGYNRSTVIKIYSQKESKPALDLLPTWYQTDEVWVNAAYIQPVRNELQTPIQDIPNGGFLGEVTVPFTHVWVEKGNTLKRKYFYYYGMTCWVDYLNTDKTGTVWYRIFDDLDEHYFWIPAVHVRQVPPEEVIPISPEVSDKRIKISLKDETLTAFENGQAVFACRVSTGAKEGDTKPGEYVVERKRPVRHMAPMEGNGYDLPGVPWVCFISWTGVSIHGTYWHNNFGYPMSHGCINLPSPSAKWVYRWTLPEVPYETQSVKENGTPVIIQA